MLISFLALVALLNALLGLAGLSLQQIFGWVFAPIAWAMGVPWRDAPTIGNLLGTRMALNEFVAYSQLGPLKASLDPRSFTIATFALCGFANFSSIGIQIGGIGALAPTRRHDLARLGLRAMLAGHARELHHRDHRGVPAVSDRTTTIASQRAAACAPRQRVGAMPDVADRPRLRARRLRRRARRRRRRSRTARSRTGRRRRSSGTRASSSSARSAGRRVAALSGRAHFYEGHDLRTVTFATRVLGRLGVQDADPDQRGRRHQHCVHAGRADGDRRSHQPDGHQPAGRPERRALRPAVSGHDARSTRSACARLADEAARARGRRGRARRLRRRCTGRATRRRPRSATCGRSAPTRSACPRCPRRSSRGTWASRCSASRASPTWPPACCRSRSTTTR